MDNKKLRGNIVKRPNGLYLVTKFPPQIVEIRGAGHYDAYITYGDPVGFLNIEQAFIDSVFPPFEIDTLTPRKIKLIGGQEPVTHYIIRQKNKLYKVVDVTNFDNQIVNVCPWFVYTMFNTSDDYSSVYF
jgi:hypothetical protein